MLRPSLPTTTRRRARGPAPDLLRIIIHVQDPSTSGLRPDILHMRTFKRMPARVADGISGQFGLSPTRVAFDTGEDIPRASAGVMTGAVLPSQAEAAALAEDRAGSWDVVRDLSLIMWAPASETVVAHVEAPGRERRVRLRGRVFAGAHPDVSCGPVETGSLLLRNRDIGDPAHVIAACSELPLEEIVLVVWERGRWNGWGSHRRGIW